MNADGINANTPQVLQAHAAVESQVFDNIHKQLGHIRENAIKKLIKDHTIKRISLPEGTTLGFCKACAEGKANKEPVLAAG